MAKYEKSITGEFWKVLNRLHEDIMKSAATMNLVDESDFNIGNINIAVRVYDKYFFRNGNRVNLSLTVAGNDSEVHISAIGAGGGQGIIFNFSLGAEDDLVDVVKASLERMEQE
jgi:hypothetical protein